MVGLAEEDAWWPTIEPLLAGLPAPVYTFVGGAERAHTVLNGLHSLSAEAAAGAHALVHDAARPCVRHTDIDRLIDEVGQASDGGILGVPVSDTVKKVDSAGVILETVDRAALWRALTPQYFRIDRLQAALEAAIAAGYIVTDEASAMEFAGYHPRVVEGAGDNIKITYDADLALAALYLDRQRETGKR
jgi:2-C-methyl-D-erythritol 4-phosphate cytidylyltransferase